MFSRYHIFTSLTFDSRQWVVKFIALMKPFDYSNTAKSIASQVKKQNDKKANFQKNADAQIKKER